MHFLWGGIAASVSFSCAAAQDRDLKEIAEIVKAYQTSIESLELRTSSYFRKNDKDPDSSATNVPDNVTRVEVAEAPGEMRYYRSDRFKDGRLVHVAEEYKTGDVAYKLVRSKYDLSQTIEVTIHRNFRGEANGKLPSAGTDILGGLILLDGSPFYTALVKEDTRQVGKEKIGKATCVHIDSVVNNAMLRPVSASFYLDPNRDYLCVSQKVVRDDGQIVFAWRTQDFMRVDSRWFPKRVVRANVNTKEDGSRKIEGYVFTDVEEIKINQKIDPKRFVPDIPEGAVVIDETKEEPVRYVKGGRAAAMELKKRLDALKAEQEKTVQQPEKKPGRPVVLTATQSWTTWTAYLLAAVSGAVLLVACWLRLQR
jgi:hypothetical protein